MLADGEPNNILYGKYGLLQNQIWYTSLTVDTFEVHLQLVYNDPRNAILTAAFVIIISVTKQI